MDALRDTVDVGELVQYIVIKYGDEKYGIPIKYIGVGEKLEDLKRFDPNAYVDELFAGD